MNASLQSYKCSWHDIKWIIILSAAFKRLKLCGIGLILTTLYTAG